MHVKVHLLLIGEPDSLVVLDDKDKISRCEAMVIEKILTCALEEDNLEL